MRRTALLFSSLLITATALAQHGQSVTFGDASGYLSLPSTTGKHPAIVVVQEWWGVNDWVKQQTDRFARQGYVALAVDLYRGKTANDPNLAHELMRGMPEDRAIADMKAGIDFLTKRDDVNPAKIGVAGWCMGGGYALGLSLADPRVTATVVNYGHLVTDPNTIAKIHTPILGNFGAKDQGITPDDVKTFDAALSKAGKSFDVKIYEGAGHAFMNPNNKEGYVPSATTDAWKRIDAFFAKHLK
jgi:carboxymethylenebutenolidase